MEAEIEYEFCKTDENELEVDGDEGGKRGSIGIIDEQRQNLQSQKFSVTTYDNFYKVDDAKVLSNAENKF